MMIFVLISCIAGCTDQPGQVREAYRVPMEEQFENSLKHTWLSEVVWDVQIADPSKPWVAVAVPDDDITWKRELIGTFEREQSRN
jgi:hypothetical protein